MKIRASALLAIPAAGAIIVAGCSNSTDPESSETPPTATVTATVSAEQNTPVCIFPQRFDWITNACADPQPNWPENRHQIPRPNAEHMDTVRYTITSDQPYETSLSYGGKDEWYSDQWVPIQLLSGGGTSIGSTDLLLTAVVGEPWTVDVSMAAPNAWAAISARQAKPMWVKATYTCRIEVNGITRIERTGTESVSCTLGTAPDPATALWAVFDQNGIHPPTR